MAFLSFQSGLVLTSSLTRLLLLSLVVTVTSFAHHSSFDRQSAHDDSNKGDSDGEKANLSGNLAWQSTIKAHLNRIPTFSCCVNGDDEQPLSFRQSADGQVIFGPFFYTLVHDAQRELEILRPLYSDLSLGVFGLGDVYEWAQGGDAHLIPRVESFDGAAHAVGATLDQPVPLFASVTRTNGEGQTVLPLYFDPAKIVTSSSGSNNNNSNNQAATPPVVTLTLDDVVQALTGKSPPRVEFVMSAASRTYLQQHPLD